MMWSGPWRYEDTSNRGWVFLKPFHYVDFCNRSVRSPGGCLSRMFRHFCPPPPGVALWADHHNSSSPPPPPPEAQLQCSEGQGTIDSE